MVQVLALVLGTVAVFWLAYFTYGRYLSRYLEASDKRRTPAHTKGDGKDFVPARRPVLLGHHFASIAGAGPIVGPITAATAFGWLPAILWIAIGNPLIGAVHDYVCTMGSVRHGGSSLAAILDKHVGPRGGRAFLAFALLLVVIVIAVFALVVALVFEAYPSAATASLLFVALAMGFGTYLYRLGGGLGRGSLVFVPLVFASVLGGLAFPLPLPAAAWLPILLAYSFAASVLPVWLLLQPRDYLSSFLLFGGLGAALLGIALGGLAASDAVALPAFTDFVGRGFGPLFPFLFVTIACGAVSGAHCLIACGTTSKQLDRESHARAIGYGGMLLEGLVAVVALGTVAVVGFSGPVSESLAFALPNFAAGGAVFLGHLGLPLEAGATFMALMLASFLLTTLDTVARLGRYLLHELAPSLQAQPLSRGAARWAAQPHAATALLLGGAYVLAAGGAWEALWPLFGSANQLLAALALFAATTWLARWKPGKQLWSTGVPAAFLFATTLSALGYFAARNLAAAPLAASKLLQAGLSVVLMLLAARMGLDTWRSVRASRTALGKAPKRAAEARVGA